jgi:hypothetical protein
VEINLETIAAIAAEKEIENQQFVLYLKSKDGQEIDALVLELNDIISAKIDCTQCGNCCKSLMINVSQSEADNLSAHLHQSRNEFDKQYVEKGNNGMMIINTIPCLFLHENKCTVYEHRFAGCREFPGLHLPHFTKRLFTIFMHYERCPIIFNVVEELKTITNFKP